MRCPESRAAHAVHACSAYRFNQQTKEETEEICSNSSTAITTVTHRKKTTVSKFHFSSTGKY